MGRGVLVDTGVLLASLDRNDRWHQASRRALFEADPPFLTTPAVMTELLHLAPRKIPAVRSAIDIVWQLLERRGVTIAPILDADIPALRDLMTRYADRPMDFADATLVHIAAREGLTRILTIDHDDFETYRIGRRGRFDIEPPRLEPA